jgi:hypothetical protein
MDYKNSVTGKLQDNVLLSQKLCKGIDINRIFMNFVAALRTTHCQRTEGACSIKPSHIYLQGRHKVTQILLHIDD